MVMKNTAILTLMLLSFMPAPPEMAFIMYGGTVTDNVTGLIWSKSPDLTSDGIRTTGKCCQNL